MVCVSQDVFMFLSMVPILDWIVVYSYHKVLEKLSVVFYINFLYIYLYC